MTNKLMICSDIHDDVEALKTFADYAEAQETDRIVILGDLSLRPYTSKDLNQLIESHDVQRFIQAKKRHTEEVLSEMKQVLDKTGIPYNVVSGNYDSPKDLEAIFGDASIHKRKTQIGNARVVGYGGADANPPHVMLLHQIGEMEQFDHQELYDLLTNERPDICVIHNPPQGLCDDMFNGQNVGTPATAQYILDNSPKLVLSGHIHEAGPTGANPNGVKGIATYKNGKTGDVTFIVNPGNLGRFELVDPRTLNTAREFDYGTFAELEIENNGELKSLKTHTVQARGRTIGDVKPLHEYEF